MNKSTNVKSTFISRTPIVAILGHVDHGKTTLLDTIRKTHLVQKEHGGITQHVGAYQIIVNSKNYRSKKITFIDTPGHEAFAKMRGRGAQVADMAILVVAGNDGVKPQTIESINHIQAAKIPCIVAINKIDLPDINLNNIKKQLTKNGLTLEEYGGDIPVIPISAKNNQDIDKLIEMVLLIAELNQVQDKNPDQLQAIVIESLLSKTTGPLATVILRSGTLHPSEKVLCENQEFKIRALKDWNGDNITVCFAGDPVLILGWKNLPSVGSLMYKKNQLEITNPIKTELLVKENNVAISQKEDKNISEEKIRFILKADATGSLEAISMGLKNNIEIILSQVGTISESDILLAKTTNSIVIGFGIKVSDNVIKLAQIEKVIIKTYNIIYKLFDEIDEVVEAIKKGNLVNTLGEAKVVALFPFNKETVAGVKVLSGRIARGDQVKIMRQDVELDRARVKSMREFKEEVNRVEQGNEAGLILSKKIDILTDDSIIAIG